MFPPEYSSIEPKINKQTINIVLDKFFLEAVFPSAVIEKMMYVRLVCTHQKKKRTPIIPRAILHEGISLMYVFILSWTYCWNRKMGWLPAVFSFQCKEIMQHTVIRCLIPLILYFVPNVTFFRWKRIQYFFYFNHSYSRSFFSSSDCVCMFVLPTQWSTFYVLATNLYMLSRLV